MKPFPIPYAGTSADDELLDVIRVLRVLSVASTAADAKLREIEFCDVADCLDAVIDRLESVLDFLNTIDFEGYIERFADCRRQWIARKAVQK